MTLTRRLLLIFVLTGLPTLAAAQSQPPGPSLSVSGTVTANHCVKFKSRSQIQDAGAACASGASGPAGGDLSGTYPNPTVTGVNGATVPSSGTYVGTNSSGQIVAAPTPVTAASTLTSGNVVLGGGGETVATVPELTTSGTNELIIGVAGSGNGTLALSGNTSGTATLTANAVAGTSTNQVVSSNVMGGPNGSATAPTWSFSANTTYGLYFESGVGPVVAINAADSTGFATAETRMLSTGRFTFCPSTTMNCTIDTGISRGAADVVDIGNGASGDTSGTVKAAGYMSVGTKFTASGCSNTTLVGGATAGSYHSGTTGTCSVTITMGNSLTAPNGWDCSASDQTTAADTQRTSGSTTTTATISGTTVSGDVISFHCVGY